MATQRPLKHRPSVKKRIFLGTRQHSLLQRLKISALIVVVLPLLMLALYGLIPPISTLMLGRWIVLKPVERNWVGLSDIAPTLPQAVIAAEDSRFCMHNGVDWRALWQVVDKAGEEGPARGASTIPMQTVKNLVLWPGRSYVRKGLELPLAVYADSIWSKRRMMENYLNVAEWGHGIFGAEAAARHYFNKSAKNLSRRESALLAIALPNPRQRNPAQPTHFHARTANILMMRMGNEDTHCLRP